MLVAAETLIHSPTCGASTPLEITDLQNSCRCKVCSSLP